MALTSLEQARIRYYLGVPPISLFNNVRVESMLVSVGGDSDAATLLREKLTRLASVEAQIANMDAIVLAEKSGSGSQLRAEREEIIKSQGRREAYALAIMMGFSDGPMRDVFGSGPAGFAMAMG